jgi:hypothetical protein
MTSTTRRAALTALAGAPVLAVPALAAGSPSTSSSDHPDAEIFIIIKRCREVDKLSEAASDTYEKVFWTQVGPAHPPRWTDADASVWPIVTPGEQLHARELDILRSCLAVPALWGTLDLGPQTFAERASEIMEAHYDWIAMLRAAEDCPAVVAAQAEKDVHRDEWGDLAERLAQKPAETVDGMIAKLAMVAIDMVYEEDSLTGDYDGIAVSAAFDAVRFQAAEKT